MPGGFLGVDVFFVISGYLITCLLLVRLAADRTASGSSGSGTGAPAGCSPRCSPCSSWSSLYAIALPPRRARPAPRRGDRRARSTSRTGSSIFRNLSYFQSAGPSAVAAARVVARGGGAVLPVLAAHPDAGAHGVGQEPQGAAHRRARRRRRSRRSRWRSCTTPTPTRRASTTAPTRASPRCCSARRSRSCGRRGASSARPAAARASCSTRSPCSRASSLFWMFLNVHVLRHRPLPRRVPAGVAIVSALLIAATVHPASQARAVAARLRGVPLDRRAFVRDLPVALADLHGHPAALRRAADRHPVARAAPHAHVRRRRAVVQVHRGTDPPRRGGTAVGPVPRPRRPRPSAS